MRPSRFPKIAFCISSLLAAGVSHAWTTGPDPRQADVTSPIAIAPNGDVFSAASYFDPLPEDSEIVVHRLSGTTGAVLWTREFDRAGSDSTWSMAADPDGDVVVCGETTLAGYGRQFFVAKLDGLAGSVLWTTEFIGTSVGSGGAGARSLALDADGNVLAAGYVTNATTGGDVVVVKLSGADGSTLWRVEPDDGGAEGANVIAVDAEGDALIASTTTADSVVVSHVVRRLSGIDGATVWRQALPGPVGGYESPRAGQIDTLGRFVVAASAISRNPDNHHWLVSAIDSTSGAVLWRSAVDGRGSPDTGWDDPADLAVTPAGTVYVVGSLQLPSSPMNFAVAALHGSSGAEVWRRVVRVGGQNGGAGLGIATTGNGDAIAVGRMGTNKTGFDMAITRLRYQDGRPVWERLLDGVPGALDTGIDVTVDLSGDVAVAGRLSSAVTIVKLRGGDGSDY